MYIWRWAASAFMQLLTPMDQRATAGPLTIYLATVQTVCHRHHSLWYINFSAYFYFSQTINHLWAIFSFRQSTLRTGSYWKVALSSGLCFSSLRLLWLCLGIFVMRWGEGTTEAVILVGAGTVPHSTGYPSLTSPMY